ncbi:MAG: phosphoribosylformylglycinamidine synthase subunit PurQ, partial [Candidatus Levybacteria bacterium]|nr:phosphoribosylformylglycinamidine synthase subunit PurQ [Candidatus Levybacteria bacterium]
MKPKILVLKTDGTNCDEETSFAFELAGGNPKIVHINDLRKKEETLKNYQILALPGGFSYGDDIVSGKILAIELTSFFSEELKKFIQRKDTAIIGVCNGFQILVRTGLLPFAKLGEMKVTLTNNDCGHFECRWINLKMEEKSRCPFTKNLNLVSYQVAHGEGKFFSDEKTISEIEKLNLVALRYCDKNGKPTQKYPDNPNGAINAIAG